MSKLNPRESIALKGGINVTHTTQSDSLSQYFSGRSWPNINFSSTGSDKKALYMLCIKPGFKNIVKKNQPDNLLDDNELLNLTWPAAATHLLWTRSSLPPRFLLHYLTHSSSSGYLNHFGFPVITLSQVLLLGDSSSSKSSVISFGWLLCF